MWNRQRKLEPMKCEVKEMRLRREFSICAFVIVLAIGTREMYNYSLNLEKNKLEAKTTVADAASDDFEWTLYRDGYSPLNYFLSESKSVFLKYAILEERVAIIEPYADMYLYVKSFHEETVSDETSYKVSACKTKAETSSTCTKGSLHHNSSLSTPINIACEPHDVYNITVTSILIDTEPVSRSTASPRVSTCAARSGP